MANLGQLLGSSVKLKTKSSRGQRRVVVFVMRTKDEPYEVVAPRALEAAGSHLGLATHKLLVERVHCSKLQKDGTREYRVNISTK